MNAKGFYQAIDGNYDAALKMMMNDTFIERMLGKFFANNTYAAIISSYESKDFKSVFAAAHSLKGVTGNLALTPLFEISSTITEATRNGEEVNIDNEIEELKRRYSLAEKAYLSQK